MAVKSPGFQDTVGNRNKRESRYGNSGANNRTRKRHKFADGVGLAFVSPDQITDTESDLAQFELAEFVQVHGSVAQDGNYEVATVVAGQLDMVEQTITAEIAGPSILINSRDNLIDSRLS